MTERERRDHPTRPRFAGPPSPSRGGMEHAAPNAFARALRKTMTP